MNRLLLLAVFFVPATVFGHHAVAAEFDVARPVMLKGTIAEMRWTNPHGWLYINATEVDGKPVSGGKAELWALEFGSPTSLLKQGVRKTDLPVGATVTVEAWRARNGANAANARKVILADGKSLFPSGPAEN